MTTPSPEAPGHEALRPHRPLTAYYTDETARHRWLQQLIDSTAADYDRIEGLTAFGTGPKYRREALARAGLRAGMDVLDVGTGTGLTAVEAAFLTLMRGVCSASTPARACWPTQGCRSGCACSKVAPKRCR